MSAIILRALGEYIYMISSILAAHCVLTVVAFGIQMVNDYSLHFV